MNEIMVLLPSLDSMLANFLGVLLGIVFGILPGLTATMGVALLIPVTFGMPYDIAFSALLGMYVGAIYAGSITAILISTPGTPAAAATLLEGPALASRGLAKEALKVTAKASFFGGVFSCICLLLLAPVLAKFALKFGPPEYFSVAFFGLTIVATLSTGNLLKGVVAAVVGMLFSTIGIDPVSGAVRNTFGSYQLIGGIALTSALVGLFAIPQVILKLEEFWMPKKSSSSAGVSGNDKGEARQGDDEGEEEKTGIFSKLVNLLRSSAIGTFIGIIPATGSGTASYVAYNEAKRFSKKKGLFGKGSYEGLVATESANNAVTGGALIPLLTLGIPGDVVTAVILGGILLQGLTPGPMLFAQNPEVVSSIYISILLANVFMLLIGTFAVGIFARLIKIPVYYLAPIIVVLCFVGGYGVNNSIFDVYVMLFFGLVGYALVKTDYPLAPLLLGFILSPLIEENFRKTLLMSRGSYSIFIERPISLVMLFISLLVVGFVVKNELFKR